MRRQRTTWAASISYHNITWKIQTYFSIGQLWYKMHAHLTVCQYFSVSHMMFWASQEFCIRTWNTIFVSPCKKITVLQIHYWNILPYLGCQLYPQGFWQYFHYLSLVLKRLHQVYLFDYYSLQGKIRGKYTNVIGTRAI